MYFLSIQNKSKKPCDEHPIQMMFIAWCMLSCKRYTVSTDLHGDRWLVHFALFSVTSNYIRQLLQHMLIQHDNAMTAK